MVKDCMYSTFTEDEKCLQPGAKKCLTKMYILTIVNAKTLLQINKAKINVEKLRNLWLNIKEFRKYFESKYGRNLVFRSVELFLKKKKDKQKLLLQSACGRSRGETGKTWGQKNFTFSLIKLSLQESVGLSHGFTDGYIINYAALPPQINLKVGSLKLP